MKVLQLIDSLHAGGAERVAVNLANELVAKIDSSYLCTSREEGVLKDSLNKQVGYLFLNRTKTFDFTAVKKFNRFIKAQQIDIVHAHSSSFFLATMLKFINSNVNIVWHDHFGNRPNSSLLDRTILKFCSRNFSQILSVNRNLESWAKNNLNSKKVNYLPNFPVNHKESVKTKLLGNEGNRVVCLANLRPEKDHINLINAFDGVIKKYPDWTLHLVGNDLLDYYSKSIKDRIKTLHLEKQIFLYGSKPDIANILSQCEIGVLASKTEGLPMSLLEYGLAGLAVIVTNVGECEHVVDSGIEGIVVESENTKSLQDALEYLIQDKNKRQEYSNTFSKKIELQYSSKAIINRLVEIYNNL